jgi:uncharacterized protein (DUF58 family)
MSRAAGLLAVAALLATTAAALASLALFALAIGLVVVTVAAGASVALAAHRLAVTRWVPQREAREDQAIGVHLQVRGLGRLPLPVHLEAQADTDGWVPLDEQGGTLALNVGRRGSYLLAPSRLRLRDALGIFEWSLLAGRPEPLLILPTPDLTVPIPPRLGAWATAGEADLDGLQPYVPGTSIGRIYWPALAREAGLQQRRLATPPTGLPLVLIDTAGGNDPRAVDWVARAAAGVIVRLAGSGGCRVLLPDDQVTTTITDMATTWLVLHRRLTMLAPGCQAVPGIPLDAGQAPVLWIRAAHVPAEMLRQQPRPLPPGVVAAASKPWTDP